MTHGRGGAGRVFTSTPLPSSNVADVCLSSCSLRFGKPIVSRYPSMPLLLFPPHQRFTFVGSSQPPTSEQHTGVSSVCSTGCFLGYVSKRTNSFHRNVTADVMAMCYDSNRKPPSRGGGIGSGSRSARVVMGAGSCGFWTQAAYSLTSIVSTLAFAFAHSMRHLSQLPA